MRGLLPIFEFLFEFFLLLYYSLYKYADYLMSIEGQGLFHMPLKTRVFFLLNIISSLAKCANRSDYENAKRRINQKKFKLLIWSKLKFKVTKFILFTFYFINETFILSG